MKDYEQEKELLELKHNYTLDELDYKHSKDMELLRIKNAEQRKALESIERMILQMLKTKGGE